MYISHTPVSSHTAKLSLGKHLEIADDMSNRAREDGGMLWEWRVWVIGAGDRFF